MDEIYVGTITLTIDTPRSLKHTDPRAVPISNAAADLIRERLAPLLKLSPSESIYLRLELLHVGPGCLKSKFAVFLGIVAAAATFVGKYGEIKENVGKFSADLPGNVQCIVELQLSKCPFWTHSNEMVKEVYLVGKGDTLSEIVVRRWGFAPADAGRVMAAVLKHYPKAFIDGNIDQLRAGTIIGRPTEAMLKGLSNFSTGR